MPVSLLDMQDFRTLFKGDEEHYGVFLPDGTRDENGKVNGKAFMEHGRVTDEHYRQHLEGIKGLGLCPIVDSANVNFAVIDVDDYSTAEAKSRIVATIYDNALPLSPFFSKSGGLHIYAFFASPTSAEDAIVLLNDYRRLFMLPVKTEIFPKQKRLTANAYGSWINLPYFGEDSRTLVSGAMEKVPRNQGFDHVKRNRLSIEKHKEAFGRIPFYDAPPCLQCIHVARKTSARNNYLLSVAVYAKTKFGDAFEDFVQEANAALIDPIDDLEDTVLKSMRKKDYSYKCADTPINEVCDKKYCQTREYGIGGQQVNGLSYDQLVQCMTDPPYYRWKINDVDLVFSSEAEIINQARFRELAFRSLGKLPYRIKEERWVNIVNNALVGMVRDFESISAELSEGGVLTAAIGEFLTQRAAARNKEQILMGKVYHDFLAKKYIFKAAALLDFLVKTKGIRNTGKMELNETLNRLGGESKRTYINANNTSCRVWTVPYASITGVVDDMSDIAPEDFQRLQEVDDDEY